MRALSPAPAMSDRDRAERAVRGKQERSVKEELPLHIRSLYRYAVALTRDGEAAHDLVQDCCTLALDRAHQFETGTNLRAWLFTIMHNRHVTHVRQQNRAGECVPLGEAAIRLVSPSDQMARLEMRDVAAALDKLDEEFREVLVLVSVEGLSYQEVADVLDIPVGTVTSRLSRARSTLRRLMSHNDEGGTGRRPQTTLRVIK